MNKKTLLTILSLLVITSLLLLACGGDDDKAEEKPAEVKSEEPKEEPKDEPVSLRLWAHQNPTFNEGYQALIDAYQAANPNVSITLETFEYDTYIQTLATSMPAGEEADIIQLFGTWTSEYAERLAPAPADVMTVDEAQALFYAAPIGGFIVDGMLYGLPQEYNIEYGGVLVNKTMYENAGLAYPPQWETMDDVLADALALVQEDGGMMMTSGFHFASSDAAFFSFVAGIRQRGGDYWNDDMTGFTFNTPEAAATLQAMVDAIEMGVSDAVLFEDAENWVGDAFFEGNVGIGYIGPWAISMGLLDFPDFEDEWDYMILPPQVDGADPVFVADSGWGLAVSPNSKHQDVAWDFCKFVAADADNAAQWNITSSTLPAIPAVAESAQVDEALPWVGRELAQLPYGSYLGSMPDRDLVVYEIVFPHVLLALQGVESIADALEMMDAEANATFE